jgi:7-cyano-7-deazaguanine synthase
MKLQKAVCILSGGLDSVVSAFYIRRVKNLLPYTITFSYGQRSTEELKRARLFSELLKSEAHIEIDLSFMRDLYGDINVLTGTNSDIPRNFRQSIVVPHRNAIFLTISAAWTAGLNIGLIAYGAHADDRNYPDCRPRFVTSIKDMLYESDLDAINLGLRQRIEIWCPAIEGLNKRDLARIGYDLLGDRIFDTWSCYLDVPKNDKGPVHCGICESCINRRASFNAANIQDRTEYAA